MIAYTKLLLIVCLICFFFFVNRYAKAELWIVFVYQGRVLELTEDGSAIVEILLIKRGDEWEKISPRRTAKISLRDMSYKNYGNEIKKGDRIILTSYIDSGGSEIWDYIEVFEDEPIESDSLFNFIVKEINNHWYLFFPGPEGKFLRAPLAGIKEYNIYHLDLKNEIQLKRIQTYHTYTSTYGWYLPLTQTVYIIGSYRNHYAVITPENIFHFFDFERNPIDTPEEAQEYILLRENMKGTTRYIIINTKEDFEKILASMNKTNKKISSITGISIWKNLPRDEVLLKEPSVYGVKISAIKNGFFVEMLFYDDCISNVALQKISYEKYKVEKNGKVTLAESKNVAVGRGPRALIVR